ncbi:MAG: type II secretion system F family protein [Deltaproteobacteria bacterium]|nr:type II secretion system F family protein [Deltaproteobacteria bacterium]
MASQQIKYNWEGVSANGDVRKGTMVAPDENAVTQRLRAESITPRKIRRAPREISLQFGTGVATKDILIFTRQLATMIDAGLPLVQCLDILASQSENKSFAKILTSVKNHVEQGATFSESLARHPKVFDELFVNLVAAGEAGGILDTILNRLAVYIEKAVKLKRQVKGAMTYPISILFVAILVITVMMYKVIPTFEEMYAEFKGATLPAPTQFVINLSNKFTENWYVFLGSIVGIAVLITWFLKSPTGRKLWDRGILKFPIIGNVLRKVVVARFTRTLGTLLSSGVPILDSLEICAKTSGNKTVEAAIMYARSRISEGKDLASPLASTNVFPSMVVQMIGVGEQTGAMDQMLQKIADFYEDEVDVAVAALTAMMEPLMMVFLGGVVGGLIVAMYLPVFELAGNID